MYKISIIESQPIIKEGLCSLLSKQLEFDLLSSHIDFVDFLREAETLRPDVVFLDLNLCDRNEMETIKKIKKLFIGVKIIIFSASNHKQCIKYALQAGANGYVHKNTTPHQLYDAVNSVAQGQFYLSTAILPIVVNSFMNSEDQDHSVDSTILTARERELLKLISKGYKNKEIANSLYLSVKTVEAHRSNIMKKLNVHNVVGLMAKVNQYNVINTINGARLTAVPHLLAQL